MMRVIVFLILTSVWTSIGLFADDSRPDKPNILLIVADDLGWQDLGCYDIDEPCPYDTTHLDALAKKGILFWQGYSPAPSCSPSRCAIISGVHPARAQKTHVLGGHPPVARNSKSPMIEPWFSGRMPEDTFTLAKAMKANGYTTGHAGKWHIAINHHAFPQPGDVGFDYTRSTRGAHRGMDDRLTGFATDAEGDPFRLDENGFPYHQNNEDALDFIKQHKDQPFFLYYCTWLVHAPIVTRNEALLNKYAKRMNVEPTKKDDKSMRGQKNPFYGAMVESLDYYMGQIVSYLETTDDPRWAGHKLIENTYIIFTSDNGGVVGYTDNAPLDKGKTSAKEGGTRVPLLIAGPNIAAGVESNVLVNGLDFYPTFVSLAGGKPPADKVLDGCDLSPLLLGDATDGSLIKNRDGSTREVMMWHFPHGNSMESTLLTNDGYKLIRNYNHIGFDDTPHLELFQLYQQGDKRVDIEEAKNLAEAHPEKVATMNQQLTEMLTDMKASYPLCNKDFSAGSLPNQKTVPKITDVVVEDGKVKVQCEINGADVAKVYLIYTTNAGDKDEEWFRKPMRDNANNYVTKIPKGGSHFFVNVIDENQYLVSYPEIKGFDKKTSKFSELAKKVSE